MKLIIDIPNTAYEAIQAVKNIDGSNEGTLENVLIKAVDNGKPIPDNATNGDVIKALFSKGTIATFMRFIDGEYYFNCSEEWWNTPYQKGSAE